MEGSALRLSFLLFFKRLDEKEQDNECRIVAQRYPRVAASVFASRCWIAS